MGMKMEWNGNEMGMKWIWNGWNDDEMGNHMIITWNSYGNHKHISKRSQDHLRKNVGKLKTLKIHENTDTLKYVR